MAGANNNDRKDLIRVRQLDVTDLNEHCFLAVWNKLRADRSVRPDW